MCLINILIIGFFIIFFVRIICIYSFQMFKIWQENIKISSKDKMGRNVNFFFYFFVWLTIYLIYQELYKFNIKSKVSTINEFSQSETRVSYTLWYIYWSILMDLFLTSLTLKAKLNFDNLDELESLPYTYATLKVLMRNKNSFYRKCVGVYFYFFSTRWKNLSYYLYYH